MTYEMKIAGLTRHLPLCRITDDLYIGAFVMLGDQEICVAGADNFAFLLFAFFPGNAFVKIP